MDKNIRIDPTARIYEGVILEDGVVVGPYSIIYPNTIIRNNTIIEEFCVIGKPNDNYYKNPESCEIEKTEIGEKSIIRSNNIIYAGCFVGKNLNTGHHVTIRENSGIGDFCSIGTLSDIQGKVNIGNFVRLHSNVHIGQLTTIKDYAWIFPYVVTTNDMFPPMDKLEGCTIEEYAIVATGSILIPGVTIGKNAFVAAGAVVSKDVPEEAFVRGVPAKNCGSVRDIRDADGNPVYPWRDNLKEYRGYPWQIEQNTNKRTL